MVVVLSRRGHSGKTRGEEDECGKGQCIRMLVYEGGGVVDFIVNDEVEILFEGNCQPECFETEVASGALGDAPEGGGIGGPFSKNALAPRRM